MNSELFYYCCGEMTIRLHLIASRKNAKHNIWLRINFQTVHFNPKFSIQWFRYCLFYFKGDNTILQILPRRNLELWYTFRRTFMHCFQQEKLWNTCRILKIITELDEDSTWMPNLWINLLPSSITWDQGTNTLHLYI